MSQNWQNKQTDELIKAVLALKSADETKRFLRDLLTSEEIVEFGKRFKAARMLANNIPYSKIEKNTGLSSTTVARVSKWLNSGMGGYKLILKRLGLHHHNHSSG